MSAKKELSKFLTEQITEWLKSGGKVKKVPPGAAKGAKDDIEVRPKNLPKTKQGRSIKFNADGDMVFNKGGLLRVTRKGPMKSANKKS